jgi:hypothetical protein
MVLALQGFNKTGSFYSSYQRGMILRVHGIVNNVFGRIHSCSANLYCFFIFCAKETFISNAATSIRLTDFNDFIIIIFVFINGRLISRSDITGLPKPLVLKIPDFIYSLRFFLKSLIKIFRMAYWLVKSEPSAYTGMTL